MGLGRFFCWKTRMTPSFQGLAGSSRRHHSSDLEAQGRGSGPQATSPRAQLSMRRFSLSELQQATDNFNLNGVIGSGGFGKVYEGRLRDGTKIAVKRRDPGSRQGRKEFHTEIELCSGLRHRHVVSLLGFCDERGEMTLVYEYMGQGTLASHLYGSRGRGSHLTWNQRLAILIGAASGLYYLHTCSEKGIIHRDVKSSNILLDDNFVAKISDYGLSKDGPELVRSHVTTAVKGTFGYLDPQYASSWHVTPGSDVYAFGVVLLEALCGRKALDQQLPEEECSLARWAMKKLRDGHLHDIVDRRITGDITPDSLRKFGEIVGKCLEDEHRARPSMLHILMPVSTGVSRRCHAHLIGRHISRFGHFA